ncbi:secretion protein domain protein (plasmid) [Azospirillum humicireducens]|uniref:Secretion protein domain protein n=1 Tax=Azospirillum humicireducens TaxID=1226968 RepID=A0A2R4VU72_9PROT|nr:HlyD family efflux transporter periplasmic adaptor subunit [Azospirillum humicireducens]AWB07931.1 secretion protein domain protein [Azospirillum humicireducens]
MSAQTPRPAGGGSRRRQALDRLVWFCGGALCAGLVLSGPSWLEDAQAMLSGKRVSTGTAAPMPREVEREMAAQVPVLSVAGTVEPGRTVAVVAPFAGSVKEKRFDYGQRVEAGQVLLVIDGFDMDMRVRDAEAALLKTAQHLDEVRTWATGAEMARAQRQATAARREAEQAQRRVQDAKPLIAQGIIPRQEYEDLQRQAEVLGLNRLAAEEELATTAKKGGRDAVRMAELEHMGALAKVEDLRRQMERAVVKAPASGMVMKAPTAPTANTSGVTVVEVGAGLSQNQSLFLIAEMDSLVVAAQVDEMDINSLRVGQPVDVTGDAFPDSPLSGQVAWIAQQATAADGSASPGASFAVRVALPSLSDVQKQRIRVGMSANLTMRANARPGVAE